MYMYTGRCLIIIVVYTGYIIIYVYMLLENAGGYDVVLTVVSVGKAFAERLLV